MVTNSLDPSIDVDQRAVAGDVEDQDVAVEAWGEVRARLKVELGHEIFDNWFAKLSLKGVEGTTVYLLVGTRMVRDYIDRHYRRRLRALWQEYYPGIQAVHILLPSQTASQVEAAPTTPPPAKAVTAETVTSDASLDPRYRFDSFVVGKSNELAYAAARRVAESSDIPFNPLFLHGGVGLGKTHLMNAIAWEISTRHPRRKVLYMSAEKFMFRFISSLRYETTMKFKEQFRSVDVLMIDDVQFIANKNSTQEEFFHTFNALVDDRRQVVISADRSPTDLEGIEERIISRLGWGLVADIHPTDYELRLGILQSKAEKADNVSVPGEVREFLARRITSNVRELEGALNRVIAYATLVGRPITMDMTREVLQDLLRANDRKVTVDEIQRKVADYYNLRLSDMLSDRRARNIARPRQVAMYLAKQLTARSLPDIGRRFGGRDHTTVIHAVKKIEDLRRADSALDDDLSRLSRLLAG